jgi:hypothetical protein
MPTISISVAERPKPPAEMVVAGVEVIGRLRKAKRTV